MYYDMDGNQINDMEQWARLFGDTERRIIARTELPGEVTVSTVWLGIDHSYGDGGPPLIFESMVFARSAADMDCVRYATREEAEAGHSELVTRWTGWTPGDERPEGSRSSLITQFLDALDELDMPDAFTVMYHKDANPDDRKEL